MTDTLRFLADVPDLSGFAWPEGGPEDVGDTAPPKSRVQIARVGKFSHPRYGKFSVSRATFDGFVRNFTAGYPTPELPADFDHEPEMGGSTAACGWVKELHPDGDTFWATVEWNWDGAYAIREKRFKYLSPTWSLNWTDDEGRQRGPTLLAFALTNRPFFSKLATVSLSRAFAQDQGQLAFEVPDGQALISTDRLARLFDTAIASNPHGDSLRLLLDRNPDLAVDMFDRLTSAG